MLEILMWGIFGSLVVDGVQIYRVVLNNGGNWPKDCRSIAFFIAECIRTCAGAGLAVALWKANQISGPIGALTVGAAAPLIVENLARQLPEFPDSNRGPM